MIKPLHFDLRSLPVAAADLISLDRKAHMLEATRNQNQLQPPPIAESEPQAMEY